MRSPATEPIRVEIEVKMGDYNILGTSLQGIMDASYKDLVKVFGQPSKYRNEKITRQWVGRVNASVFTIYDYKSSVKYGENRCWHIGGSHVSVAEMVAQYFNNRITNSKTKETIKK